METTEYINNELAKWSQQKYHSMRTKIFKGFIASPSDTTKERELCDKVFKEINNGLGEIYDFRIESLKWENDVRPSLGKEGQAVINEQIGKSYDIFIGIMYKKFGTATNKAGSGTEEEFNLAFEKYKNTEGVEIMIYFNNEAPKKLSEIDPSELEKVNSFKDKIAKLGIYSAYSSIEDFEEQLRKHLTKYFIEQFKNTANASEIISQEIINKEALRKIFQNRFSESLIGFNSQPIIWVEPVLSKTKEIYQNADENFEQKVSLDGLIKGPSSTIIQSPPQFGATALAHYLIKEAWEKNSLWIYLDSELTKPHNIDKALKREIDSLDQELKDVKCIVLDSWENNSSKDMKKLQNLSEAYPEIPIIVMQRIDDSNFLESSNEEAVTINRNFKFLHLLALPRHQIRQVVSEYNKAKDIGEEDIVLSKLVSDLEILNIHRTPYNCLTLLKVSEMYFDESPVNRTKMVEMVLFVLFNVDNIPTYKSKPDLKDCEYVLGLFCEDLIRNSNYYFTRESFLEDLNKFCQDKLIDLEVEVVFDVLNMNNIIVNRNSKYCFKSSFWIYYFGAKRMHIDPEFADYIFKSEKYISFPEIVEFYTGIDRNRADALRILSDDIKKTCEIVYNKIGIPGHVNPFANTKWQPKEEHIQKMQEEISENVLNSGLPDEVKDRYADKTYNQIKPYNQSIQSIFEEYSLLILMQKISASSRALRNSDYVEPDLKKGILNEILRSWEQLSKVLFALAPIMAEKGRADFQGAGFELEEGNWGNTFEEKLNRILQANPTNVVGYFKNDLYSNKIGPLLFEQFNLETAEIKKHHLALLIIFERPRNWKKQIELYIVSLSKDSFFLYDTVNALRARYKYDFVDKTTVKEIEYLIKMGLAKHEFGDKKPRLDKITRISNKNLPKRENEDY